MVTVTLDDRDREILGRLGRGNADVSSLAASVGCEESYLEERLPELADNGLVLRVHSDVYTITANGKRTLAGSPEGAMDNRIDTPPDVEETIESFGLRSDREAAVRNAFAFLQYWGEATRAEILDGVYSENPAGFESATEWWADCVRDHLAALPRIEAADSSEHLWRYTDVATVDQPTDDGREVSEDVTAQTSVKFAIERSDLDADERSAVRAAFDFLVQEGTASAAEIKKRIFPDHGAGYEFADSWWAECVGETFESLPGVERTGEDEDIWAYEQSDEGPASTDPGADVPDERLGPPDDV
jgi:DNA-binding Lrp family transcriptional regulator